MSEKSPLISVIIPVFNVEPYLDRCLHSVLSQEFADMEVICINDASTDNSLSILQAYVARDSRVLVINFDMNQGVGVARNTGIRAASGKTICFVDPDDFLPEGSLEKRFKAYLLHDAVIKGQRIDMTPEGQVTRVDNYGEDAAGKVFRPSGDISCIDLLDHHQAWLFPAELLLLDGVEYAPGMRNAQDLYFLASVFFHIEKMICINDPVYALVHRQGSATNRSFTSENYVNIIKSCMIFYEKNRNAGNLVFGDFYFNKRIIHTLTRMVEKSGHLTGASDELQKFIEYGLYIFHKYNVGNRLMANGMSQSLQGILLLQNLSREGSGTIKYRIYKAQKKLFQKIAS